MRVYLRSSLRLAFLCGLLALACVSAARADVWDLVNNWSDLNNPNGVWTYRDGSTTLPHVDSWQSALGGYSSAQPGWAHTENDADRLPVWYKSVGGETFDHDWLSGDVVVHTTAGVTANGVANVLWTSPFTGSIDVSGAAWMGRDIGRSNDWEILLNGSSLTIGSLSSGDSYDRANPFTFDSGSGGAGVLNNISVSTGDTLELRLTNTSTFGDFVGVNLSVHGTPIASATPEPGVSTLFGALTLSSLGYLIRRRRRN